MAKPPKQLSSVVDDGLKCSVCEEVSKDLVGHVEKHMKTTYFSCESDEECLRTTDYKTAMAHLEEGTHKIKFTCLKCTISTSDVKTYMNHLWQHQIGSMAKRTHVKNLLGDPVTEKYKPGIPEYPKTGPKCLEKEGYPVPSTARYNVTDIIYPTTRTNIIHYCHICAVSVQDVNWNNHMKHHLHNTSILCHRCKSNFIEYQLLSDEKKSGSSHQFEYYCHQCNIFYFSLTAYLIHMKEVDVHINTAPEELTCSLCHAFFPCEKKKVQHMLEHCNDITYFCQACFKIYNKDYTTAIKHFKLNHSAHMIPTGVGFLCHICGEVGIMGSNESSDHMLDHVKGTSKPPYTTYFACQALTQSIRNCPHSTICFAKGTSECPARYTHVEAYFIHIRDHFCTHLNDGKNFQGKRPPSKLPKQIYTSEMKQPEDTVENQNPHHTERAPCQALRKRRKMLRESFVPSDITDLIYPTFGVPILQHCLVCLEEVADDDWMSHMQLHLQESSISCRNCKKNYVAYLLQNEDVKSAELHQFAYYCHICRFYHLSLKTHLRHLSFHTCVKETSPEFTCVICSANFQNKVEMQLHMSGHYKDVWFFCGVCLKEITSDLTDAFEHFRSKHTALPRKAYGLGFMCRVCGEVGVAGETGLSNHLAMHCINKESKSEPLAPIYLCQSVTQSVRKLPHCEITLRTDSSQCQAGFQDVHSLFTHVNAHVCRETNIVQQKRFKTEECPVQSKNEADSPSPSSKWPSHTGTSKIKFPASATGNSIPNCIKHPSCKANDLVPYIAPHDITEILFSRPNSLVMLDCTICEKVIPSVDWNSHMQGHLEQTSVSCRRCNLNLTKIQFHEKKLTLAHDFAFHCHTCMVFNQDLTTHLRHLRTHECAKTMIENSLIQRKLMCALCPTYFITQTELRFHIVLDHYRSVSSFCKTCFERLDNYKETPSHFQTKHGVNTIPEFGIGFLCHICGAVGCKGGRNLSHHLSKHGLGKDSTLEQSFKPLFKCRSVADSIQDASNFMSGASLCDATFEDAESLLTHVNGHFYQTDIQPLNICPQNDEISFEREGNIFDAPVSKIAKKEDCQEIQQPAVSAISKETDCKEIQQPSVSTISKEMHGKDTQQPPCTSTPSNAKIKIYGCKVCSKRFLNKHFLSQHLMRAGH